MSEIVLFHPVLGVRPGVRSAAERLREAGHTVHVPDLYDGAVFDDYDAGAAHLQSLGGYPELLRRTAAAVEDLPADLVYAGFSNGGGSACYLAMTRPGARAVLSMHAAMAPAALGMQRWPGGVPVQVHYGRDDPFRSETDVQVMGDAVRASGSTFEYFEYPVSGHLFTDESLPAEHDPASAELMWDRALEFLARLPV